MATGLNEKITLHFMEPGHTKCTCDGCFGVLRLKYRRATVFSLEQLHNTINKSSKSNKAQMYQEQDGDPIFEWQAWDGHCSQFLAPLKGIWQFHLFEFYHQEPATVHCRKYTDSPDTQMFNLQKKGADLNNLWGVQPRSIAPGGLSAERQAYLYNSLHQYIPERFHQDTCPKPTTS